MGFGKLADEIFDVVTQRWGITVSKHIYDAYIVPAVLIFSLLASFLVSTIRIFIDDGLFSMLFDLKMWPTFALISVTVPFLIKTSLRGYFQAENASYNNSYKYTVMKKAEKYILLWVVSVSVILLSILLFNALEVRINWIGLVLFNICIHILVFCGIDISVDFGLEKLIEQQRELDSKAKREAYKQHKELSQETIDKETRRFMEGLRNQNKLSN